MGLLGTQFGQILRRLGRAPMFTALTLLTLSVGIGGSTAIFSIVDCVLLKPLPYPHPEELVTVRHTAPGWNIKDMPASESSYFIYREQNRTFQDIGLYYMGLNSGGYWVNVMGSGGPERVPAIGVTDGILSILRAAPLLGRFFTVADNSRGSADTVILTYGYWRRKFGGDRSVVGKTLIVEGRPHVIVGVLPQRFCFLDKPEVAMLLPLKLNRAEAYVGGFNYEGMARLKPGVTLAEANADVARMLPMVEKSFPPPPGFPLKMYQDARFGPNFQPLKQEVVGDVGRILWVLMGGISLVLVIACANLTNFLLVRAEGRQQELAIRAALGASRRRIAAELFLESLVLAVFGGLLGLGLAYGAVRILVAVASPHLPRLNEIGLNGIIVLFALAISLGASVLFGSFPAFKYADSGFGRGLREVGRSMSESRERHRSRGVLVVVQVALALVLLAGSGLMIRTFRALTRVNPGFLAPSEVQTFLVSISGAQAKEPERVLRVLEEISHKIEAIPGVASVSISRNIPMDGSHWSDPVYARDHAGSSDELLFRRWEFVAPGYFKTLGTPLVAGRDFTWNDVYNKVPMAIVSEKFAREYWQDPANALGKQVREKVDGEWREVVGVVGDVHQDGVEKEPPVSIYWPVLAAHFPGGDVRRTVTFAIRSPRTGSEGLMDEVQQAVWSVIPNLPLAQVHTLDYYYAKSMERTSFTLVMLAVAGGMALLLGILGLYGVIAYSVSQRRRAIGIRMALGAGEREVLKMVVSQGVKLALIGVGVGIAVALTLTRFLSGLLYGVKTSDPPTLAAVSALLIAVSLLASYVPARQAVKVDPTVALRHE
jgi:putative ABC transport system permease protein